MQCLSHNLFGNLDLESLRNQIVFALMTMGMDFRHLDPPFAHTHQLQHALVSHIQIHLFEQKLA